MKHRTNERLKRARRIRAWVCAELRSRRHVQFRHGKGDWKETMAPRCFAHVVKNTLHMLGERHGTSRSGAQKENVGNRDAIGLTSGAYQKLVELNDKGVSFSDIANVLEALPFDWNKNSR